MAVLIQPTFGIGLIFLGLCVVGCLELARSIYLSDSSNIPIMVVLLPTLLAGATSLGFFVKAFQGPSTFTAKDRPTGMVSKTASFRSVRWFAVFATTTTVGFGLFWMLARAGNTEYIGMTELTVPLSVLVILFSSPFRQVFVAKPVLQSLVAAVVALLAAVVWTFVAIGVTSGYVLASDANPLVCWTAASFMGSVVAIYWPQHPRRT